MASVVADMASAVVEVSTVPAVVHAKVGASGCRTEVVTTPVVVAASANDVPGMTATVAGIEHGASEVEVVTMRIARIDAEVPVTVAPVEWAIEIACLAESAPLPVEQDIAHVEIAALPIIAIHIVIARYPHQVVEINLVGSFVLLVCQIQLVSHLVSQEQSFVACLFVAHCLARCCYCQHCNQGYHHLLHNRNCYLFTVQ